MNLDRFYQNLSYQDGEIIGARDRENNRYSGGKADGLPTALDREAFQEGYEAGWTRVDNALGDRLALTSADCPEFELQRFNRRRLVHAAEAAEVKVTWPDGSVEILWMSMKDIRDNRKNFGYTKGLAECAMAYLCTPDATKP